MKENPNSFNIVIASTLQSVTKKVNHELTKCYPNAVLYEVYTFNDIFKIVNTTKIDLLITDVYYPDGNILTSITKLKKSNPKVKILIISDLSEDIYAVRSINSGTNGFISIFSSNEEIMYAINQVLAEKKSLSKYL